MGEPCAWVLGVLAAVFTAGVAPAAAATSPWTTNSSIQATIHESAGSYAAPLVASAEIEQNVDISSPEQLGINTHTGGVQTTLVGMSLRRLSEVLGVAPSTLATAGAAMTVTPPNPAGAGFAYATQADIVNGVSNADGTLYDLFSVANPSIPGVLGWTDFQSATEASENYDTGIGSAGGLYRVDVYVNGTVLGVPGPVFTVCAPGVGQSVDFGLPPGGVVTLGQQSGSPADANGLRYSWDFGDGSPATPFSGSSSTTYVFAAQGTFDVRMTAQDAAGNAGVSPVAAQVVVGPTQGTPGPCGTVPGQPSTKGGHNASRPGSSTDTGGSNLSGGGTNAGAALSSGAASGSVHAPTSHVAPRKTGAPPSVPPDAASSGSGSARSGGGGGSGRGGSAGGRRGGGAAGARAGASGAAGGRGKVSGTLASGASVPGAGAGRTKLAKRTAGRGGLAPPGLRGLLIESAGSPLSGGGLPSASVSPLSLLQSVARESAGGGGSGGLPAWLLGVVSLLALLVLGVVREAGPGLAGRLRRSLGAGRLRVGAA